ncbi:MAG: hypothetical protein WDO18_23265 [Acidobacteriota bacterium]
MSKLAILALAFASLLAAKSPQAHTPKVKHPKTSQRADKPVIYGNAKTVGADPNSARLPAVKETNTVGNEMTVGGDERYTPQPNPVGPEVGQSETVGGII